MLPDKCSITHADKQCVNPPEFIVSIVSHVENNDEYMVAVTCQRHKLIISAKIKTLQDKAEIYHGKIRFSPVKAVGTDCIRGDQNDVIQIDMNRF